VGSGPAVESGPEVESAWVYLTPYNDTT